MALGKDIP
jgi:hypothetical protein